MLSALRRSQNSYVSAAVVTAGEKGKDQSKGEQQSKRFSDFHTSFSFSSFRCAYCRTCSGFAAETPPLGIFVRML